MKHLNPEKILKTVGIFIVVFAVILALPAFSIWLGLPPEGDAVDYRVPLIKWMFENKSIPDWQWTIIDDYPALGEILYTILYGIHPNLMRLLPLLSYLALGFYAAKLAVELAKLPNEGAKKALFWIAWAWILGLRPALIQANLLMVDNLSSMFVIGSLFYIFKNQIIWASLFSALALSTRYSAWPIAIALLFTLIFKQYEAKKKFEWKNIVLFCFISFLGALPFLIRNSHLNNNPFYPLLDNFFNGTQADIAYFIYGRGKDIFSFLLLPYDFLYTNSYVQAYFDYTLGKLFYLQILAFFTALLFYRDFSIRNLLTSHFSLWIFFLLHLLTWFFGSQQMRFFVPGLVVLNLGILIYLYRRFHWTLIAVITMATTFSILSVQKDSILLALGKKESIFKPAVDQARGCLNLVSKDSVIGFDNRDGILGFFDYSFRFYPEHPYAAPEKIKDFNEVEYIYSTKPRIGFSLWPIDNPCMLKRNQI
ncbi:MAG: hypothetical protein M9962_05935 [Oligoflexia bacterium]|nr:hypothetical protein [Oligoflexia bacterium]